MTELGLLQHLGTSHSLHIMDVYRFIRTVILGYSITSNSSPLYLLLVSLRSMLWLINFRNI